MEQEVTLDQMLEAREQRAARQRELLEEYSAVLICFTMNIAGPVKNSQEIRDGFRLGLRWLHQQLLREKMTILWEESHGDVTGNEAFLVIRGEPLPVKQLTALLEDGTSLGRIFDMDVLCPDGRKVTREEISLQPRSCLLCGGPAAFCARSRRHSVAELQERTRMILRKGIMQADSREAAQLAVKALLFEVCTSPKPGLVDRFDSGSHKDMDILTFMGSASALWPYFADCTRIGRETAAQPARETFRMLRQAGKLAEGQMLEATGGINTHKGVIFSMGLLCGALGRLRREQWRKPDAVLAECAAIVSGLTSADFAGITREQADTAGKRLYLEYGITGVRGQAEAGFPTVRNVGLPVLEAGLAQGKTLEESGCGALLAMLCGAEDTNLLARSDLHTSRETAAHIADLLRSQPYPDQATLEELNRAFVQKNLSPGGSADLLAICYLLHFLKEAE